LASVSDRLQFFALVDAVNELKTDVATMKADIAELQKIVLRLAQPTLPPQPGRPLDRKTA